MVKHTDILVVGGGISGLLAACMFDRLGLTTRIVGVAEEVRTPSVRTVALFDKSISWLSRLGVWGLVMSKSNRLQHMILGDKKTCHGVTFDCLENHSEHWAQHLRLRDLELATREFLNHHTGVRVQTSRVIEVTENPLESWVVDDEGVRFSARTICAADGRNSIIRKAMGIPLKIETLDLSVLVARVTYKNPQDWEKNRSSTVEIYGNQESQTIVPLYDGSSALLWLGREEAIKRLKNLENQEILKILHRNYKDCNIGSEDLFADIQGQLAIPMSLYNTNQFSKGKMVLLGESCHGFPPIAAQGLNLTIRDLMCLGRIWQEGISGGWSEEFIARKYDHQRRQDILSTSTKVGFLSKSIIRSDNSPIGLARSLSLNLMGQSSVARRLAVAIFGSR